MLLYPWLAPSGSGTAIGGGAAGSSTPAPAADATVIFTPASSLQAITRNLSDDIQAIPAPKEAA